MFLFLRIVLRFFYNFIYFYLFANNIDIAIFISQLINPHFFILFYFYFLLFHLYIDKKPK